MIRKRYRLWRIKRALEIRTIYPEVKAYALRGDPAVLSGPRQNGKTTAVLLRAMVRKDIPPIGFWHRHSFMERAEFLFDVFFYDPDFRKGQFTNIKMDWYGHFLIDALVKVSDCGIDVYNRDRRTGQ